MFFTPIILATLAITRANAIVSGAVFDRYISIWLENTDFSSAAADANFQTLMKQGLQFTNYFGVTHPSEPNYVSVAGGEYFGMDNDNLNDVPANVSTIVDLLEDKGITWAEYQEDLPSTGFTGFSSPNKDGANDYVRKHNPLVIYQSVSTTSRVNNIKNFTSFQQDLADNKLPQWIFITPNMTNDGHDSSIAVSSKWALNFLTPLLKNSNFNPAKTLVLLSFDEAGTTSAVNHINTVALGSALPAALVGKTDDAFYNHYSEIATVEANWNLHTLGRYDVGANVFSFVANVTGDTVREPTKPALSSILLNKSYPGIFNSATKQKIPIPNTSLTVNKRTVLPAIVSTWGSAALQKCTTYSTAVDVPSASNPPTLPSGC